MAAKYVLKEYENLNMLAFIFFSFFLIFCLKFLAYTWLHGFKIPVTVNFPQWKTSILSWKSLWKSCDSTASLKIIESKIKGHWFFDIFKFLHTNDCLQYFALFHIKKQKVTVREKFNKRYPNNLIPFECVSCLKWN